MRNIKKLGFYIFCFILLSIIVYESRDRLIYKREPYWHSTVTSHRVAESDEWENVWVHDRVFIEDDDLGPMISANNGLLFALGGLDIYDRVGIIALDANTGELIWQSKNSGPAALFATPLGLYVGFHAGGGVTNYDLGTGEVIWKTLFPGTRGFAYLNVMGDEVYAQVGAYIDKFYVLDATNGEIKRKMNGSSVFVSTNEVTYRQPVILSILQALDTSSREILWEVNVRRGFLMNPTFTDDEIIVRTDIGGVYCVDRGNGLVKWHTDNLAISNVIVVEHDVVFLTRDGELVGLDISTGENTFKVQFDTDRFILTGEALVGGYNVAYDPETGLLFAQLGDSDQIFAFSRIQN
jgi:outer membrane protein assembly factor BamB